MKKLLSYALLFIVFQVLIVFLALMKPSSNWSPYLSGYIVHFIAVSLSVLLLFLTLTHDLVAFKHPHLLAFTYGVVISVTGELVQLTLSYRNFDYVDMLSGIVATVCVTLILKLYNKNK